MPNRSMDNPFPLQFVKELLWRTGLIGMALFVLPRFAVVPTFSQLATIYIVIIIVIIV